MRLRLVPLGAAAVVLAAGACTAQRDAHIEQPPDWVPASAQLASYDSCDEALDGLQETLLGTLAQMRRESVQRDAPGGFAEEQDSAAGAAEDGAAAPGQSESATEYSETNTAVAGVDEPDIVKTDGQFVYTVVDSVLRVVNAQTAEVEAELEYDWETWDHSLFLGDDELLVMYTEDTERGGRHYTESAMDRLDPATLDVLDTFRLEGSMLDARMVGGEIRLAVQSSPHLDDVWEQYWDSDADNEDLREAVRSTEIEDWLPSYSVNGAEGESGCEALAHPDRFGGQSLVSVLSLDADGGWTEASPTTVAADGGTVHGTAESLYLAHSDYNWDAEEPEAETEIYRFVFQSGQVRLEGEGAVPGSLLNQYSMSEYGGHLRVATTEETQMWWGVPETGDFAPSGEPSKSTVTVLAIGGQELTEVGSVTDLGPDERIYAVRFIGETGYVVTFRETDPLYTVDLSDPANPIVTGELKITGYSAYLHPVADGRLLGVGQDATETGQTTGLQVSLFDVSGEEAAVLDQYEREGSNSAAEWDPHGFLYWEKDGIVVLPVWNWDGGEAGAVVLEVTGDTVTERAWIEHEQASGDYYDSEIVRSLVIGDQLWTVSNNGLQASDIGSYDTAEWIAW